MNGQAVDAQTKALEFFKDVSLYLLIVTMLLLAWIASGVEFSSDVLRLCSMFSLLLSIVFGVCTLALIPLVQETRRPGQSNFDVWAKFRLFGDNSFSLKATALPQYVLLVAGVVFYTVGMIE